MAYGEARQRGSDTISLLYSLAAVNTFATGLFLIWLAAYFVGFKILQAGVIGHALIYLAAGVAFIGFGHFGLAQGVCVFPSNKSSEWAREKDACSVFSIGFGVFVCGHRPNCFVQQAAQPDRA